MRYAVLIYQDERLWTEATAPERAAMHAAHGAFDRAVRDRVALLGGEALTGVSNATTLRRDPDGAVLLTDGPFAETAEQLGGFYVVDAPDLDTMTELCALLPAAYTLEIRPVAAVSEDDDWVAANEAAGA